ncbi:hypothetical protein K7W42_19325 [Deinococcus sp. HMF7604]|uniref:hypothetical protein n=1 Tax=Deinococcus betulae TaxID=2873312 RepID=UPI001CC92C7B|nr:hypothetical protein [Deinococcus betulae]MBZ9752993.1 hypothetical protein [Deinococcus betulae]
MEVDVQACQRCGQDHRMGFGPLDNPVGPHTHWGLCPNTGQPVLLAIEDTPVKVPTLRQLMEEIHKHFGPVWLPRFTHALSVVEGDVQAVLSYREQAQSLITLVSRLLAALESSSSQIRETTFFQELLELRQVFTHAQREADELAHDLALKVAARRLVQELSSSGGST